MLYSKLDSMTQELRWPSYSIFRDIDGPGPGNAALLDRMERPKEGGVLAYLVGYKYAYKGNPRESAVRQICVAKKAMIYFKEALSRHKCGAVIMAGMMLMPIAKKKLFNLFVHYTHKFSDYLLYDELLKPERYCRSIREIYRAFTKVIEKERNEAIKKLLELARNFFCMVLEQDSAYRFRFQDIMAEARKEELAAGGIWQIKEIIRLFNILYSREMGIQPNSLRDSWRNIKRIVILLYISQGFIRKSTAEFFKEANLEEIRPDEGDDYFNAFRNDYLFRGKSLTERMAKRKETEGDGWVKNGFDNLANEMIKFTQEQIKRGVAKNII